MRSHAFMCGSESLNNPVPHLSSFHSTSVSLPHVSTFVFCTSSYLFNPSVSTPFLPLSVNSFDTCTAAHHNMAIIMLCFIFRELSSHPSLDTVNGPAPKMDRYSAASLQYDHCVYFFETELKPRHDSTLQCDFKK